jgi:sugar (pentulose or hexulose) kinase
VPRGGNEYVLAVDLGASGPKVSLFDTHGELVDSEFEPVPLLLFPGGGAEALWQGVVTDAAIANRVAGRKAFFFPKTPRDAA